MLSKIVRVVLYQKGTHDSNETDSYTKLEATVAIFNIDSARDLELEVSDTYVFLVLP